MNDRELYKPNPLLRYVKRRSELAPSHTIETVLQQEWGYYFDGEQLFTEWRDVPTENEVEPLT